MKINMKEIEKNWQTYEKLCDRLSDQHITDMLQVIGERIVMCPGSQRLDQYNAHPGGLIRHALDVASTMRSMNESQCLSLETASILKVSLLHDLGKIGDLKNPLFVDQDSDWHREKLGQMYKYNEDLQKMSISHRTLFLLQLFNISLSSDEWLAIQLAQGSHFEENRFYVGAEPTLALCLQQAKNMSIHKHRLSI